MSLFGDDTIIYVANLREYTKAKKKKRASRANEWVYQSRKMKDQYKTEYEILER